jgi:hypothetical protein
MLGREMRDYDVYFDNNYFDNIHDHQHYDDYSPVFYKRLHLYFS